VKSPTRNEAIRSKVVAILKSNVNGMRYSELVARLQNEFPDFPVNTIHGAMWDLNVNMPSDIYKPFRGLYRHVLFQDQPIVEVKMTTTVKPKEEQFYQSFAEWLVTGLEECTKAIALGGSKFKGQWGTSDVIGVYESGRSDLIKANTEIISAEIKTDTSNLVQAFGQACCYKLFSHKSYLAIPRDSSEEDKSRLDALCLIFGIGLVLFDGANPKEPRPEIRVRPSKTEPDMFYVNKYLRLVENDLFR
jgi:hypothetical protein